MPDQDFDIAFKVLPPELQMKLWVLALDANTSKVAIAYRPGSFTTSLTYNYGGNVEAALSVRRGLSSTIGVNPSNGDVNLSMVYRGFRFGADASYSKQSAGFQLGYGANLLPYPRELAGIFESGASGLQSMARDIGAAPNNPLAWYKMKSNDASAIAKAVATGQQISKLAAPSDSIGVGLRLNYSAQSGFTIYGGLLLKF
jgi:hypothetical protein